jgi:hypothetical protein
MFRGLNTRIPEQATLVGDAWQCCAPDQAIEPSMDFLLQQGARLSCFPNTLSRLQLTTAQRKSLALGLNLVAIRLVLRLKVKILVCRTKKHLTGYCS